MKKQAAYLGIVIYFPFILYAVLLVAQFEVIYFNYLNVLFFLAVIAVAKSSRHRPLPDRFFRWCIAFNIAFVAVGFMNLLIGGVAFLNYFAKHYGVFLSTALIFYFATFRDTENIEIFNRLSLIIGGVFIIQLAYSFYESVFSDVYIVNSFDWNGTFSDFDYEGGLLNDRLQIEYFFQYLDLPIRLVFTGLLGQHNHWGTQLPFYNLIFIYQYYYSTTGRLRYLGLLGLVLLAAILNTSRFGILAIIITDIVFFYYFTTINKRIKALFYFSFGVLLLIFAMDIYESISTYVSLTNTFSTRQDTWSYLWPVIWDRSIFEILFGSTLTDIVSFTASLDTPDFENLSYTFLFEKGLLIHIFFVLLMIRLWNKDRSAARLNRITNRLIVVNIILVSLWSNVFFRYSSVVFATLLMYRTSMVENSRHTSEPINHKAEQ